MEHNDLLSSIKRRDPQAYRRLSDDYGWKLYSYLSARFRDRETVDAVYSEVLSGFYNTVAAGEGDDPVEALLFAFAERTCSQRQQEASAPKAAIPAMKRRGNVAGSIGFALGLAALLFGILAATWVILGLLMDMNILPPLDLGYEWFNANVLPMF